MAKKSTPPAMMLYTKECDQLLSGEYYTAEEVGEIMIAAWAVFKERMTEEEAKTLFKTRDMAMAFNNVINSAEAGRMGYDKRVEAGGLGGITRKLIDMPGWTLERVKQKVKELREKSFTDEEITLELKTIYNDAKHAKTISEGKVERSSNSQYVWEDKNHPAHY